MVEENESTRGIACVARICCPVRMCQPIPASPSNRTDSGVNTSTASSAKKNQVRPRGHRHARPQLEFAVFEELLEPSAIAVNLIEVDGANGKMTSNGYTSSRDRRRRFRRPKRRAGAGQGSGADHGHRPQEFPHLPAASLPGGNRRAFSGRNCRADPLHSSLAQKC